MKQLQQFLQRVSKITVIVGSVARKGSGRDLDLLWDFDSDRSKLIIQKTINDLNLEFSSSCIGSWTFNFNGLQVELLPIHEGSSYKATRKRCNVTELFGVEMFIADPLDA